MQRDKLTVKTRYNGWHTCDTDSEASHEVEDVEPNQQILPTGTDNSIHLPECHSTRGLCKEEQVEGSYAWEDLFTMPSATT